MFLIKHPFHSHFRPKMGYKHCPKGQNGTRFLWACVSVKTRPPCLRVQLMTCFLVDSHLSLFPPQSKGVVTCTSSGGLHSKCETCGLRLHAHLRFSLDLFTCFPWIEGCGEKGWAAHTNAIVREAHYITYICTMI